MVFCCACTNDQNRPEMLGGIAAASAGTAFGVGCLHVSASWCRRAAALVQLYAERPVRSTQAFVTSRPACAHPEAEAVAPALAPSPSAKQTDSQKAWKQCSYIMRVRAGASNETFCRLALYAWGQLSSLGRTVNDDLSAHGNG